MINNKREYATRIIGPMEQLPDNTRVRVGTKIGTVVKSKIVPAIPSGNIVVHTVAFTHRITRWPSKRIVPLDKTIRYDVNYSGINVFED